MTPTSDPSEIGTSPTLPPDAPVPDADAFGALIAPASPRHRSSRTLYALLSEFRVDLALPARVERLEALAAFLLSKRQAAKLEDARPGESPQVLRLRMVIHALERVPVFRDRLAATLAATFREGTSSGLFGRLGLPTDRGFFAETIDRFSRGFLPEARDPRDLQQLVAHLFPSQSSLDVLSATPQVLVQTLVALLGPGRGGADAWAPLVDLVLDAEALLATRVSALGLSDVIRTRSPEVALRDSPFFKLPRSMDRLMAEVRGRGDVHSAASECTALIDECRRVTEGVVLNLEQYGVSVDVVYRIELITKSLGRLGELITVLTPRPAAERAHDAHALLVELVDLRLKDRRLLDIMRGNLHLLARKIIERAGHTGEHYITSSRTEYAKMLLSAGGGGVLTAGTTALKYMVLWGHFAPFVEGMLAGANYAGSFLLMQFLGFTLATKQPSMTAAALAGTLRESNDRDLSALVKMIARITRSQLAAAVGNIGLVIPAAYALDRVWRIRTGEAYLTSEAAEHVLTSLDPHPLHSGTLFYAALTGVLLWTSSIAAGWVENWAVFRRLPEAIAQHRMGRWVGRRTMHWVSRVFLRNISGIGGNTALGFLLGMTPILGKFFGLPLDVRHVTLSTGSLTLGVCAMGTATLHTREFVSAAIGIGAIGILNFGVSFVLALAVALRARDARNADRLRLLMSVVATFIRSPLQFIVPPATEDAPVHGPVSVRVNRI